MMHPLVTPMARVAGGGLFIVGIQLWLIIGRGYWGTNVQVLIAVLAGLLLAVPLVRRTLSQWLDAVRSPSPAVRTRVAVAIAMVVPVYLYVTAIQQGRPFLLMFHDELQFRLQTVMAAHGHLWLPTHPLADFFDTFYVLNQPVYAAQSFPGLAILYAPTVWIGLPWWIAPLIVAGMIVGLSYRIVSELIDGLAGGLCALFVVCTPEFRRIALMNLAQGPMLLSVLALAYAYLRWRPAKSQAWALLIGVLAGWSLLIRPADALLFIGPVGLAMAGGMRHHRATTWCRQVAYVTLGAVPFILLQLSCNFHVTGSITKTPFALYNDMYQPGLEMGFRDAPAARFPVETVEQKKQFYLCWMRPFIDAHTPAAVFDTWRTTIGPGLLNDVLPSPALLILLPLGLWAMLQSARTRLILLSVAGFVIVYVLYPIWVPHYAFVLIPIFATMAGAGAAMLPRLFATERARSLATAVCVVPGVYVMAGLPQINRLAIDDFFFRYPEIRQIEKSLNALPKTERAIVLFQYTPAVEPAQEPVYNIDAPNPDDCRIVRAHDLGEAKNQQLFAYYARRQPDRVVYRCIRPSSKLDRLGSVNTLAEQSTGQK